MASLILRHSMRDSQELLLALLPFVQSGTLGRSRQVPALPTMGVVRARLDGRNLPARKPGAGGGAGSPGDLNCWGRGASTVMGLSAEPAPARLRRAAQRLGRQFTRYPILSVLLCRVFAYKGAPLFG